MQHDWCSYLSDWKLKLSQYQELVEGMSYGWKVSSLQTFTAYVLKGVNACICFAIFWYRCFIIIFIVLENPKRYLFSFFSLDWTWIFYLLNAEIWMNSPKSSLLYWFSKSYSMANVWKWLQDYYCVQKMCGLRSWAKHLGLWFWSSYTSSTLCETFT